MTFTQHDVEARKALCEWKRPILHKITFGKLGKGKCVTRRRCCSFFVSKGKNVGPYKCGRDQCTVDELPQEICCVEVRSSSGSCVGYVTQMTRISLVLLE